MFNRAFLLTAAFFAITSSASPLHVRDDSNTSSVANFSSVDFDVTFNLTSGWTLPERDLERVAYFLQQDLSGLPTFNATGNVTKRDPGDDRRNKPQVCATNNGLKYTVDVNIGSPATSYKLIVDTGSSNTWVGAGKKFVRTQSSHALGKGVGVHYDFTDDAHMCGDECERRLRPLIY